MAAKRTHEADEALHALLEALADEHLGKALGMLDVLRRRIVQGECPDVTFCEANSYYPEDCYVIGE